MSLEETKNIFLPDKLTEDQKDAVLKDGEIIVSAAAGSGKTSTMINRIMRLVLEGVSIKDMLVVVYNNSAADELREKLHQALYDAACVLDGTNQNILKKQLDELAFAHISTIHAYCQSLIKENFNHLGISPTFEVLDEDGHNEYMQKALDNVLDAYDKENDEAFEKIVEVFAQRRKEDNLKDNVIKLFKIIDIQPNKHAFFDNVRECYADYDNSKFLKIILDFEHEFFGKAKRVLGECKFAFETAQDPMYGKYLEKIDNAYDTATKILSSCNFGEICDIAYSFEDVRTNIYASKWDEFITENAKVAKACIGDMKKEFEKLAEFRGREQELRRAHIAGGELIEKFVEITKRFGEELSRLKSEDNVLAFEDLQHKAVELLSNDDLHLKKFKQVFVDEYQDVNPTQEYIIAKLIDGNCFMVGDTKQSIYAFRLADPTNFANRQARYERGEGTAIYFNRNFRSGRKILEFVNEIFDRAMTKDIADVDYKHDARFELEGVQQEGVAELHLFYCGQDKKEPASGVYDILKDDGKENSLTAGDLEGVFVANKIAELVGRVRKDDGTYLSFGDVTITMRNRSANAQRIVAKLKEAGIPVDDSGFEKSKSEPERELIEFLRVIDNPRQDIPFAGFLLSFFGGYTEQELVEIASEEAPTFYDKFLLYSKKSDKLAEKIKDTQSLLEKYRIKASFKNVRDLAGGIVADFSYDAYLGKNGEADVYGLKAFISGIADKDNANLGKFLRNYGASTSQKSAGTKSDRVHISTFHGYKGLENEVVFVCDLDAGFNASDVKGDFVVDGKGYIAINNFDFENASKSDKTISRFATRKLYDKKTLGEEMRLLYVALTRAKRYMFVTSTVSKDKLETFGEIKGISAPKTMLDIIGNAICDGANIDWTVHAKEDFGDGNAKKQAYVFPPSNKTLEQAIERAQEFVYPHKVETELAIKYSVSQLDSLDEQTISAYAEGDFKNLGTIYHKIMQYIDFDAQGVDGVKAELDRLVEEKYLAKEEIDEAREVDGAEFERKIADCLACEIIEYAKKYEKVGKCKREQPFMMYKPARDVREDFDTDEKVLVQGVIDLFIDGDKRVIVDFKNSNLYDKESLKKYEKQLNLYKIAVESAINAKVDEIVLYSFKTRKAIKF